MVGNRVQINELLLCIRSLEGWLTDMEQIALLHLAVLVDHVSGDIVEIGSFKGKSTVALGMGSLLLSKKKRSIYAIDPFSPQVEYNEFYYDIFRRNIEKAGLIDCVKPIRLYSHEAYDACPDSIAGLFIDGDHSYVSVTHDIIHFAARVVPGGLVAFHDYAVWPGVTQAVDELLQYGKFKYICDYDSLRLLQKK